MTTNPSEYLLLGTIEYLTTEAVQTTWYKMLSFLSWCTCKTAVLFLHMKQFIDRPAKAYLFWPSLYITVAPKSQLSWLNLPHSQTLPPPATARHRMVKFQETSLKKRQMAIWRERLWEKLVLRQEWKNAWYTAHSCHVSNAVNAQTAALDRVEIETLSTFSCSSIWFLHWILLALNSSTYSTTPWPTSKQQIELVCFMLHLMLCNAYFILYHMLIPVSYTHLTLPTKRIV